MPALRTTQSMSACAWMMLLTVLGIPSSLLMSNSKASALSRPYRSTNLSRFSFRRPVTITKEPSALNLSASASPMPVAEVNRASRRLRIVLTRCGADYQHLLVLERHVSNESVGLIYEIEVWQRGLGESIHGLVPSLIAIANDSTYSAIRIQQDSGG